MELTESTLPDWHKLSGSNPKGIEITVQSKREKYTLEEIQNYAVGALGLSSKDLHLVESNRAHLLDYSVYTVDKNSGGKKYISIIFIAHHFNSNLSYIMRISAPGETYEEYKEEFKFWYKNIFGL